MKQKINLAIAMIWMLCLSMTARGQTISSSLPDTICVGASGTYFVTPISGATYSWNVTPPYGNISGSSATPSVLILWGMPGTVVVSITINNGGVITTLYDTVVVEPLPQPFITANILVGCQSEDTGKNNIRGGAHIDDGHGCVKVCQGSVVTYTGHGPAGSTYGWV